ncbi:MAG: branched-chain amino acid ABC transporter permease [Gammaproteobacteria bacterium]|nr:branched-chain amino acid ABC transporter permease [Gammaproteobacteria bacterium]
MNKHMIALLCIVIVGAFYPLLFPGYLSIAITLLLFVGWATAWDILGGWAGQVSLGHASFVGLGGYFVAVGATHHGLDPWWTIAMGMASAAALAFAWGKLTFKLTGPYFTLSTIAIAEIIRLISINEGWLTGGATGVFIFSLPEPFGVDLFARETNFYLALAFAALCIFTVISISRSKFGYQLRAVREDESSAMASGINPATIKLKAFMISAGLTALGGGIYAIFLSFLEPHFIFFLLLSVQIALTAIIGGRGTIWGPAAGAVLIIGSGEVFRTTFAEANMLIYGLLIMLVVIFMPRGIIGEPARYLIRRTYAKRAQS